LGELATELAVQWIAVVKRVPGPSWDVISSHGRHSLSKEPWQFWDEAQERECAGLNALANGWSIFAIPFEHGSGPGDFLVGATRNPDENLLSRGILAVRSFALAVEMAGRQQQSRQHIDRLKSTLDIASRLSSAEETAPLLDLIAREATRLLDCDRSSIFLWDRERGEVEA
ncbi:MAG: sigma-54-dependent Fis family transcriptional regulator, partial [Fuerstiella sp.]|nr:sigma-54-dependent Fis family transcriptional regulator [Fuerstiella sp.]